MSLSRLPLPVSFCQPSLPVSVLVFGVFRNYSSFNSFACSVAEQSLSCSFRPRSVSSCFVGPFHPLLAPSHRLLHLPFRCILLAKFNLPFFALKSLGSVWPKRDEVGQEGRTAFGFTFSLFLIYFLFYALLRLQLPPANFDPLLLQFLYFILFYFFITRIYLVFVFWTT